MNWDVVSVKPLEPLELSVLFRDGTEGRVRFEPSHLSGVFEALKAPELFRQVRVEEGAVTWPGEIDLAPDAMYREIKRSGEWVLR
jgi:Lon protease-like protein